MTTRSREDSTDVTTGQLVVTLGGPYTFAGQALEAYCQATRQRPEVDYAHSMDDVWDRLGEPGVTAVLLTGESTSAGLTEVARRVLAEDRLEVLGEVVVQYHCTLLAKEGTRLEDVRRVTGHGSLVQCRRYLSNHLPGIPVEIHAGNSLAAAEEVASGDGTEAVVGTRAVGKLFGLTTLADDVDEGAQGAWWIIGLANEERPAERRGSTVVAQSVLPSSEGPMLSQAGWTLRSLVSEPTGATLGGYRLLSVWETEDEQALWSDGPWGARGRFNTVWVS